MKLINLNQISKTFGEKYYDNKIDDIIYDIIDFNKKLRSNEELGDYDAIKMFKAIIAYCGVKHVDINKFIKLKIE